MQLLSNLLNYGTHPHRLCFENNIVFDIEKCSLDSKHYPHLAPSVLSLGTCVSVLKIKMCLCAEQTMNSDLNYFNMTLSTSFRFIPYHPCINVNEPDRAKCGHHHVDCVTSS